MSNPITPSHAHAVVYVADSHPEAHIVMGRLHNEGIPATITYEPAGTALGLTVGKLGGFKLVVRIEDYEQALAILDEDVPYIDDVDDQETTPEQLDDGDDE